MRTTLFILFICLFSLSIKAQFLPNHLIVLRTEKDKRSAYIKWQPVDNAFAYNLYYGTAPDKLYSCIMIHDFNEYWFKAMDRNKTYYFSIEAINENGVSEKYKTLKVE